MKLVKIILGSFVVVCAATSVNLSLNNKDRNIFDVAASGIESLTTGDDNNNFGCGRAAYQWKDKNVFGHVNFVKCQSGCPEGEGRDPQYMNC